MEVAIFDYIVRSVGERTEEVCVKLLEQQAEPGEKISIIKEPTHAGAVERTVVTGLDSSSEWIVAVDADMLLVNDALAQCRSMVSRFDNNAFVAFFGVYDKLYRMKRWGVTFYRRAALGRLYDEFRELKGKSHRKIEGAAITALRERGMEALYLKDAIAMHDYEQYYRDLYRKAYLNCVRNPGTRVAVEKWKKWAKTDPDYLVMLKAYEDAIIENRNVTNSVNDFNRHELEEIIASVGLEEKSPLTWPMYSRDIEKKLTKGKNYNPPKDRIFADYFENDGMLNKARAFMKKLRG